MSHTRKRQGPLFDLGTMQCSLRMVIVQNVASVSTLRRRSVTAVASRIYGQMVACWLLMPEITGLIPTEDEL